MAFAWLRRLLRSRWSAAWLAWALCLPVAQWTYAAHAFTHVRAVASEERDNPAQAPAACVACVVGAAIGGAAPLPVPPVFVAVPLPHILAERAAPPAHAARPALPYRSRAPPVLPA